MARCELKVEIQAPVDLVWNLTQDLDRRPEWDFRIEKSTLIGAQAPGKGVKFRTEGRMLGRFSLEMEYVTFEVNKRSAVKLLQATGMPFISGGGSWRYEVTGEDRCLFHTSLQMNTQQSPLASFIDKFLLEPMLALMTRRSLYKLKAVAEADFRRHQTTILGGDYRCTPRY